MVFFWDGGRFCPRLRRYGLLISPSTPVTPRAYVTVRPLPLGTRMAQSDGVAWMKAALSRVAETQPTPDLDRALRFYDLLARQATIDSRVTCLDDYTHQDWDRMRVHTAPLSGDGQEAPEAPHAWFRAPLDGRMAVFAETALDVARQAFADDTDAPDLLVQVSCTGYDSPNAVQHVAAEHGWTDGTRVLSLGHMGCYAAVPALATAADAVAAQAVRTGENADAAVLLVELCTLHHDPATTDVEQIVQQCLFGDGAARMDVTSAPPDAPHFALLDHAEGLLPDTLGEMSWRTASPAFRMTLSRDVPKHIRKQVGPFMEALLARNGLTVDDVDAFAVHPGGPRVIESTAEALGLPDHKVTHSHAVLRERGNMSSTTLPHIWARLLADDSLPDGALVASVAFGPGLTVVGNLMRKGA